MVLAESDIQENPDERKTVLEELDDCTEKIQTVLVESEKNSLTKDKADNNEVVLDKEAESMKQDQEQGVWQHAEGEFICGMISNSDSVGGFKGIMGKGVQFDDGVFEMVLIRRPHNLLELTDIINELLSKKLNSDNIVYSHVSAVKLKTAGELPWSLDGEYGGDMPQAEIHILKQAVDYIRDM